MHRRNLPRLTACSLIVAAALCAGGAARADENLFGYVYGADTTPRGEWELYQWITNRTGKVDGTYRAFDLRTEVETGLTDRTQLSLYLNGSAQRISGVPGFTDRDRRGLDGASLEVKSMLLSPYKDPIGLAVYLEPGYSRAAKITGDRVNEYELEAKVIVQKNFLEDRLVWSTNYTWELEFEREAAATDFEGELAEELTSGLSYRFAPNWFAGVEGRVHSEFPDLKLFNGREHMAYFLGPNLHYGAKRWWFTLSVMPQINGWPDTAPSQLHLVEHERLETRLKIGINLF
jgi:Family of unknown function (DUF6662)